jgi:hypothetical protein
LFVSFSYCNQTFNDRCLNQTHLYAEYVCVRLPATVDGVDGIPKAPDLEEQGADLPTAGHGTHLPEQQEGSPEQGDKLARAQHRAALEDG